MARAGFTGQLLDRYLASGWYRMGTRMFTCRYNFYDWGFLTTVWTRLVLDGHVYPKRTAKVRRRNLKRFRHEIHPARADHAEEELFEAYAKTKSYELNTKAADYLRADPLAPFDTQQISVYDGEKLIAFSYFDIGKDSVQSVCGFYDPSYGKFSLGLYTLILEVDWCKQNNFAYHYAGYIVPGNEIFEYKRKVGELEAYDDVEHAWYPIAELDFEELPHIVQLEALDEYAKVFGAINLSYSVRLRPQFLISITQQDLQWLRREQLPFCITEDHSNRRPYYACHFFSFTRRKYFSLLCTSHAYDQESLSIPPSIRQQPDPAKRYEHIGSGMAVRLLHVSNKPYTAAELHKVWDAVKEANLNL